MRPHVLAGLLGGIESLAIQARAAAQEAGADLWELFGDSPYTNAWTTSDGSGANAVAGDPLGRVNATQESLGGQAVPVANGDFSAWDGVNNPTSWTVGVNTATEYVEQNANGLRMVSATGAYKSVQQAGLLQSGRTYKVTVNVYSVAAGSFSVETSTAIPILTGVSASGSWSGYVYVPVAAILIIKRAYGLGLNDFVLRSVEVTEVYGNHLTQATAGSKPTAILGANGRPLMSFDGGDYLSSPVTVTDANNYLVIVAGSVNDAAVSQILFSARSLTNTVSIAAQVYVDVVGRMALMSRSDDGTQALALAVARPDSGVPWVLSGRCIAGDRTLWRDGVQVAVSSGSRVATVSSQAVGSGLTTTVVAPMAGRLALVCVIPSASVIAGLATAERITAIERYAAALVGATYLG